MHPDALLGVVEQHLSCCSWSCCAAGPADKRWRSEAVAYLAGGRRSHGPWWQSGRGDILSAPLPHGQPRASFAHLGG